MLGTPHDQTRAGGPVRCDFVAVADLCDCAPLYLCADGTYRGHGSYDQTIALVDPSDLLLKLGMEELVTGRPAAAR